ncbi:MAG TPA: hypothetical protein DD638_12195, partial [Pasteurellaceae bacterium]|nr:hypothetical protein [Pasteurellaceae bacterium]
MNKKAKLTLNFSILSLVLGVGTQFYTNYKIDQTLKQFPYHFKDHFIIQVAETNSDFFTRDLIFGIKYKDQETQTDFIHTKLTALPFIINAESYIPTALIKDLNKKLNITIDKNTINSQFSVFGENLQSDILTQFRDSTNTQQILETELTYSPRTGFMELQTNLSGLNYDQNTKIKNLSGEFLLKPVGESHYDMIKADVDIENIDIFILDGDNSHIELAKTNYRLNKYIDSTGYDLTTRLYSDLIKLSNKNTLSEQEKTKIEGLEFSTKQLAVPSHVTFYDQLHDLAIENINLREIGQQLTDSLFNNDLFETRLKLKNVTVPKADKMLSKLK